eukprot:2085756-Pleurochrysis_carterae.AAC.1
MNIPKKTAHELRVGHLKRCAHAEKCQKVFGRISAGQKGGRANQLLRLPLALACSLRRAAWAWMCVSESGWASEAARKC